VAKGLQEIPVYHLQISDKFLDLVFVEYKVEVYVASAHYEAKCPPAIGSSN
jgi:hypothetical protein